MFRLNHISLTTRLFFFCVFLYINENGNSISFKLKWNENERRCEYRVVETTTESWIKHDKNRGQDTTKQNYMAYMYNRKKDSINSKLLPALFTGCGKLNFVYLFLSFFWGCRIHFVSGCGTNIEKCCLNFKEGLLVRLRGAVRDDNR